MTTETFDACNRRWTSGEHPEPLPCALRQGHALECIVSAGGRWLSVSEQWGWTRAD